jgi:hypothetical protein
MRLGLDSIPASAFFGLCAGVAGVGVASWRRTAALRRGSRSSRAPPQSVLGTSSRLTFLAASAGMAASLWGATLLAWDGSTGPGVALLVGGGFVAVAGSVARVTHLRADRLGVTVRYSRGKPFSVAWSDLLTLRPPRSPLGGWRFHGRSDARTLMPSDLWGKERLLWLAAEAAGLHYDGRSWRKESAGTSRP